MFKKLFLITILLLIGIAFTILTVTGIIKIPLISSFLAIDNPKNLIGEVDPNLYKDTLIKGDVTLINNVDEYCLTCDIAYEDFRPLDITISSVELTSLLRATNNNFGPLKEIQIKLNDNNQAEMSAHLNLKDYGYDFSGPIYAVGSITKKNSSNLNIQIERVEAGIISIPKKYVEQGEYGLNLLINNQLSKMKELKIDSLEISNNALHFQGDYPRKSSVK